MSNSLSILSFSINLKLIRNTVKSMVTWMELGCLKPSNLQVYTIKSYRHLGRFQKLKTYGIIYRGAKVMKLGMKQGKAQVKEKIRKLCV